MDPPGNLGSRGKCVLVIVVVKNVLIQGDAIAECCRVLYCRWLCLRAEVEMRILLLQLPAIAEDCYILVMLFFFYFFFRPPNFRHPWADFRETLPHDAVCAEIVYLL